MKQNQKITCTECNGYCCRGMELEIEKPVTDEDFENLKWYLYHERTHVYIDNEGDWIVATDLACEKLDKNSGECTIYENRPPCCKKAPVDACDRNVEDRSVRFHTAEELDRWCNASANASKA